MHQWFSLSQNDINVNRDDVDRNFAVHLWQIEHTINIVLNHSILNKIYFNVSNANNLLTIYTQNLRLRIKLFKRPLFKTVNSMTWLQIAQYNASDARAVKRKNSLLSNINDL